MRRIAVLWLGAVLAFPAIAQTQPSVTRRSLLESLRRLPDLPDRASAQKQEQCDNADQSFDRATVLAGCDAVIASNKFDADAKALAYRGRAIVEVAVPDYAAALDDIGHGLALVETTAAAQAKLILLRGLIRWQQHDQAAARTDFGKVITMDVDLDDARISLISLDIQEGKFDAAQHEIDLASFSAFTDDRQFKLDRVTGDLKAAQKDFAGALAMYQAAAKRAPTDMDIIARRSNMFYALGQYENALVGIDAFAEQFPNDASALNEACWIRAANLKRDFDRARTLCDAAHKAAPASGAFLDSVGLVALQQKRWQDAWTAYDGAIKAGTTIASCYYGRGIAALRLGREADGNADIAKAIRTDPAVAQAYSGYGQNP